MRGRALVLGLLLVGGCSNQWQKLDQITNRVLASCSGKCAAGTPQHKCLVDMRQNVAASVDQVPPSCATWSKP